MDKNYANLLDTMDPLACYRQEFYLPNGKIYLDGNSLGLCSKRAESSFHKIFDSWKTYAIDGWIEGENPWFYLAEKLGELMSPLVGADKHEVIVTGSTTVNLHQVLSTFYRPTHKKYKIVTEELSFPSDMYAIKSHLSLRGYDRTKALSSVKSRDGRFIQVEDIIEAMKEDVALIILPTVLYRSGQLLDVKRLTREAHQRGIIIGFDACHSVGAVPHRFFDWGVDFAFWCTYKYLNGGPGSVASLYINERYKGRTPGIAGWFSSKKDTQFDMDLSLCPAENAGAFQIGTPHILSSAPLLGSLELINEVTIEEIRKKSLRLTRYLMDLVKSELAKWNFTIGNPLEDHQRGGHVSLEHKEAVRICKALREMDVIPDFRKPNVIRLAPISLYTSYVDVFEAVERLNRIMEKKLYLKHTSEREVIA